VDQEQFLRMAVITMSSPAMTITRHERGWSPLLLHPSLARNRNAAARQIDLNPGSDRPRVAANEKGLGDLREDLLTLQAEVFAVQWNAADHDRLPVARPNSFQPPVIGNRQRHAGRRRRCQRRDVYTRVGWQKQVPRLAVVATCDPGAGRQPQSK